MKEPTAPKDLRLPPKLRKAVEQAEAVGGLGLLFGLIARLGLGGKKLHSLADQASALRETRFLASLPETFNSRFLSRGWIISESTSVDAAREAIVLADQGAWEDAEQRLAEDYQGDRLDFLLMRLRGLTVFRPRAEIAAEAAFLCQAARYIGAVPLLFIIADGMGQDAFRKSIFSDGVDLTELNALAGQPSALSNLVKEICRTRKAVNAEPIYLPYRNGILHGRDVNFGNSLVAAKLWSLLSCMADVIRARQAVKASRMETEPSLRESLMRYSDTLTQKRLIEAWQPRPASEPEWRLSKDSPTGLETSSPEAALAQLLISWQKRNYGEMGRLTLYFDNRPINKRGGEIRQVIGNVALRDAVIERIEDQAAAVTIVDCTLSLEASGRRLEERFQFRISYGNENGDPLVRGHPEGIWRVMPGYQGWILGKHLSAT